MYPISIRFLFEPCRIVRGSKRAVCHAAEHDQKQCCSYERASPYPILNHARITFPAHNAYCKLTQRAGTENERGDMVSAYYRRLTSGIRVMP